MAAFLALALFGCDEAFELPPQPDLYKVPYDFSVPDAGANDQGVPDQSVPDLKTPSPDFAIPHDLLPPPDGP